MRKHFIALFLLFFFTINSYAASFDCSKASAPTDKAICSDAELSKLDETMGSVYKKLYAINPEIKSSQRDWIKNNRQCSDSSNLIACLKDSYKNRLSVLNQLTDANRGWIGCEIDGFVNTNQGTGATIGKITPNSPAQTSGLQTGDIVYQINGKSISDPQSLISALSVPPGSTLNLKVLSKNNPKEVVVKAGVHPSTQPAPEQQVSQQEAVTAPPLATSSEPLSDTSTASSTEQVITPEPAQQLEQPQTLPEIPEIPTTETPVEVESSSGSLTVTAFILAAILGWGVFFWLIRKKKNAPKITEPKIQPVVVKQEPKVDSSYIPVEKKSTEEIKVHHHVSEQKTQAAPQKIIESKVEEVSEPETSEKVNISMSQLRSFMKDEEKNEEPSLKQNTSTSNLKFELVIMEGDKRLYELPLSFESVQSIVSSTPDNKFNDDLFLLASHHSSSAVRQSVACKDSLSESIIRTLSNDLSVNVLRNLVSTNGFKEFATEDVLAAIISRDNEAAQTIAGSAGYFDQVPGKTIAKLIHQKADPAIIENLDEEFR